MSKVGYCIEMAGNTPTDLLTLEELVRFLKVAEECKLRYILADAVITVVVED